MKYIITETQRDRIEKIILDFFDKNIIPPNGWKSKEEYENEIIDNGGEIFINLTNKDDDENFYDDNHIYYSECENENLSKPLPEDKCPFVILVGPIFVSVSGYFGDMWIPLFKEWFIDKTGLFVKKVEID